MRERHNWGTGKHPKTCTCSICTQRRADASVPRSKKKRKPKSERGKTKKSSSSSSALDEAMDILNRSSSADPTDSSSKPDDGQDSGRV